MRPADDTVTVAVLVSIQKTHTVYECFFSTGTMKNFDKISDSKTIAVTLLQKPVFTHCEICVVIFGQYQEHGGKCNM